MDQLQKYSYPLGRVLLGVLFLAAGMGKLQMGADAFAGFIESQLPLGFLAWPTIIFEIAVGVLLIVGYQTRWVALAAAGFCVFTGVIYHGGADVTGMLKNIALAGGYLLLFSRGGGGLCVDKT
ncbi:MAG: DoxX family protein [Pseudomonadota bacterium]